MAQKRVGARFQLRGGTGGKDGCAVARIILVICGCLLMSFNCAAEAPTRPERQHLQVQIGVDRIESAALQQSDVNLEGSVVDFFAPVSANREPVPEKKPAEKGEKRENEQNWTEV